MKQIIFFFSISILIFSSCKSYQAKTYDFPKPVDTTDKPIERQTKKQYSFPQQGVYADNLFDGARLNDFMFIQEEISEALTRRSLGKCHLKSAEIILKAKEKAGYG